MHMLIPCVIATSSSICSPESPFLPCNTTHTLNSSSLLRIPEHATVHAKLRQRNSKLSIKTQ